MITRCEHPVYLGNFTTDCNKYHRYLQFNRIFAKHVSLCLGEFGKKIDGRNFTNFLKLPPSY